MPKLVSIDDQRYAALTLQSLRVTIGPLQASTASLESRESYLTAGMLPYNRNVTLQTFLSSTRDFYRLHSTFARLYNAAASPASRLRSAGSLAIMPPKPDGSGAYVQVQEAVAQPNLVQIPINIPLPSKLELTRDLATNWKKFHRAWNNYEIAARLKDPENPTVNKPLRTATLLTCIGSDALDVYEGLQFANEDDKKDIDVVLQKLQRCCIGETNEIYERYRFNKRDQEPNESLDAYVTALRALAKTCNFGVLENSLIRDRIVIGVRDTQARKKLLQVSKLTLKE